jgi:hypothetical protein
MTEDPTRQPKVLELTLFRHDLTEFCRAGPVELRRAVRPLCRDEAMAEDVVQETLLVVRSTWHFVGNLRNPMGWAVATGRRIAERGTGRRHPDAGVMAVSPPGTVTPRD